MKGASINMQIECDCGALVEIEKHCNSQTPMLKEFKVACECGRSYYTHVQEVKKHG